MITDLFLSIAGWFATHFIELLDAVPAPDSDAVISPIRESMPMILSHLDGMGAWLPFDVAGRAMLQIGLAVVAMWAIKIIRMILSLFTAGGGSAA